MSGRELRICRDTQLAIMGHIMTSQFGEEALDILAKWQNEKTKKRWSDIARLTGRIDPEYLFSLFSKEAHEFEIIRKNATGFINLGLHEKKRSAIFPKSDNPKDQSLTIFKINRAGTKVAIITDNRFK